MSRYIDADALIGEMRGRFIDSIEENIAVQIIKSAPSIDIVRCKECKLKGEANCAMLFVTNPDDFCSYGEREGE